MWLLTFSWHPPNDRILNGTLWKLNYMNLKYFSGKPKYRLTSHVWNEIFDEREKGSKMMEAKEFLMCLSLSS